MATNRLDAIRTDLTNGYTIEWQCSGENGGQFWLCLTRTPHPHGFEAQNYPVTRDEYRHLESALA